MQVVDLVGRVGLEPTTKRLRVSCSNSKPYKNSHSSVSLSPTFLVCRHFAFALGRLGRQA